MVQAIAVLSSTLLICVSQTTPKTADKVRERPISISLEAVDKAIKKGTVPKFRLTIRNEGTAPERVIDLRSRRSDLQDTYYHLAITQDGKAVSLPRAISDPPISDRDFLTVKPGEKVTFELTRFAIALEKLLPGKYEVRVRFWQDPRQSSKTGLFSPSAEFVVQE
jgi:hypothetical protein